MQIDNNLLKISMICFSLCFLLIAIFVTYLKIKFIQIPFKIERNNQLLEEILKEMREINVKQSQNLLQNKQDRYDY